MHTSVVSGNDLVTALTKLSSGEVREWTTDSYEDALEVRDYCREEGMRVRVKGNDDVGWTVERVRDRFGRWRP